MVLLRLNDFLGLNTAGAGCRIVANSAGPVTGSYGLAAGTKGVSEV
jgi:hypothetical protein